MSTGQMIEILGRLRKQMNGEVSELMMMHGVNYALNYGVAIHSIKEIARDYAPNTKLARLLYSQQVRDLQIAACYIADPADILIADQEFWGEAVVNGEMAEQLSGLIARCEDCDRFVESWLGNPNSNLQYCALLAAAKSHSPIAAVRVADYALALTKSDSVRTRVIATILSKNYNLPPIAQAIIQIKQSDVLAHKQINDEIYIYDN